MKPSASYASPSLLQADAAAEQRVLPPESETTTAPAMTIGARVRQARLAAHQTQQQLAGEAYSKSYLSAVERDKMIPSFQALGFLAQRLGLPVSYFLGEDAIEHFTPELERPNCQEHLDLLRSEAEELIQSGWYEEARASLQQHLEEAQQRGDGRARGVALGALVAVHIAEGQYAQAIEAAREALAAAQAAQDHRTAGQMQLTLVRAHAATHDEAAAEQAFRTAIALLKQAEDQSLLSQAHEQYGHFLAARKRYQEAYQHLEAAQRHAQR
ncbi:MAG TPA: helix-turn-helix transcriptional regulator [Ktedonobacterales bacterium]